VAGRKSSKQETRDALIKAGIALFGEQGLDGPSLDAICERAGFTRGAFYVHFKDRDEFLVAVMDRVGWSYLDAVIATSQQGDDLAVTIQRFVESVASGFYPLTRAGGVRPHQLLDACARSPLIRERYVALVQGSLERVRQVVNAGQASETVRKDVPAGDVATILLATVIGAQTMLELGLPLDAPALAATVLGLLRSQ
jgi:AcrR family transcriptional regulator